MDEQLGVLSNRCLDLEVQLTAAKTAAAAESAASRAETARLSQEIAPLYRRVSDEFALAVTTYSNLQVL